jgi:hypothetical protein
MHRGRIGEENIPDGLITMKTTTKFTAGVVVLATLLAVGYVLIRAAKSGWIANLFAPDSPALTIPPEPSTEPAGNAPPLDWRPQFFHAYALDAGQTVKCVPAPFLAERLNFMKSADPKRTAQFQQIPEQLFIEQQADATFTIRSFFGRFTSTQSIDTSGAYKTTSIAQPMPLDDLVTMLSGLKSWQIHNDPSLTEQMPPADWVVRAGSSRDDILRGLADEFGRQFGKVVNFTYAQTEMEVIAVNGKPRSLSAEPATIVRTVERQIVQADGSVVDHFERRGGLDQIVDMLTERTGAIWLNQAPPDTSVYFKYDLPPALRNQKFSREAVDNLAKTLSDQSGLIIQREQRLVDIWTLNAVPAR